MRRVPKWQLWFIGGLIILVGVLLVALLIQQQGHRSETRDAAERFEQQREADLAEQEAAEQAEHEAKEQLTVDRTEQAQSILQGEDVTVLVLGDSTGNEDNEWVYLWAETLAANGAVIDYHLWDSTGSEWPDEPRMFGAGAQEISLWNGSHPGAKVSFPLDDSFELPDISADLIVTNFGHNGAASVNRSGHRKLWSTLETEYGDDALIVAISQNPSVGDTGERSDQNRAVMLSVAAEMSIPVIDVHSAFGAGEDLDEYLLDGVHPNSEGSRIWADAVTMFFE